MPDSLKLPKPPSNELTLVTLSGPDNCEGCVTGSQPKVAGGIAGAFGGGVRKEKEVRSE